MKVLFPDRLVDPVNEICMLKMDEISIPDSDVRIIHIDKAQQNTGNTILINLFGSSVLVYFDDKRDFETCIKMMAENDVLDLTWFKSRIITDIHDINLKREEVMIINTSILDYYAKTFTITPLTSNYPQLVYLREDDLPYAEYFNPFDNGYEYEDEENDAEEEEIDLFDYDEI